MEVSADGAQPETSLRQGRSLPCLLRMPRFDKMSYGRTFDRCHHAWLHPGKAAGQAACRQLGSCKQLAAPQVTCCPLAQPRQWCRFAQDGTVISVVHPLHTCHEHSDGAAGAGAGISSDCPSKHQQGGQASRTQTERAPMSGCTSDSCCVLCICRQSRSSRAPQQQQLPGRCTSKAGQTSC